MPELEDCYSMFREDLHHSIQHVSLPIQIPAIFIFLSQNYLTINSSITIQPLRFLYIYGQLSVVIPPISPSPLLPPP
ncbi:hypothetical protein, partial [Amazonocrinis nigriterrae]|uniref:hypothetical protein n=1 Tax=Amazonocrinis nigriterrae TaxID=2840443 RepID=UPI001BE3F0AE